MQRNAMQAQEYLAVLEAHGEQALAAYQAELLTWEEVKALTGEDTVGLPLGYRSHSASGGLPQAPLAAAEHMGTVTAAKDRLLLKMGGGEESSGAQSLVNRSEVVVGHAAGNCTASEHASKPKLDGSNSALPIHSRDGSSVSDPTANRVFAKSAGMHIHPAAPVLTRKQLLQEIVSRDTGSIKSGYDDTWRCEIGGSTLSASQRVAGANNAGSDTSETPGASDDGSACVVGSLCHGIELDELD